MQTRERAHCAHSVFPFIKKKYVAGFFFFFSWFYERSSTSWLEKKSLKSFLSNMKNKVHVAIIFPNFFFFFDKYQLGVERLKEFVYFAV